MNSLGMPVVSGNWFIRFTSRRARHAAAPRVRAAAAPLVTMPASAPVARAITSLAAACSSSMRTQHSPASRMASSTSLGSAQPPAFVLKLRPLISGRTPSFSYTCTLALLPSNRTLVMRGSAFNVQHARRIGDGHLINRLLGDAAFLKQWQKASHDMRVTFAAVRGEMAFLTDVSAQYDLRQMSFRGQKADVSGADLIGGISVTDITDVVDTQEHACSGNFQQLHGVVPVAQMTDDDALGGHAFFLQQRDLLHGKLAEVRSMRHGARAGTTLGASRRAEDAFLGG